MNTTHVRNAATGEYERRPWALPLVIIVCPQPECRFESVAVSDEAADAGLWTHTIAMHLGESHASTE